MDGSWTPAVVSSGAVLMTVFVLIVANNYRERRKSASAVNALLASFRKREQEIRAEDAAANRTYLEQLVDEVKGDDRVKHELCLIISRTVSLEQKEHLVRELVLAKITDIVRGQLSSDGELRKRLSGEVSSCLAEMKISRASSAEVPANSNEPCLVH